MGSTIAATATFYNMPLSTTVNYDAERSLLSLDWVLSSGIRARHALASGILTGYSGSGFGFGFDGGFGFDALTQLAQKPHEPHAAFLRCAKPHAEIKFELGEKPGQRKGSQVEGQGLVGEKKKSLLPQLLRARREKYREPGESIELTKTRREPRKNPAVLRNAQKPSAARAAFAQAV
ncbi:hypothetical protein B0H14DRAFT_2579873 [Mycena olivaceomarginata]|nr:hypothetical protein B0H14DRAFT_2579873 [Mycena olivaceomarginata]